MLLPKTFDVIYNIDVAFEGVIYALVIRLVSSVDVVIEELLNTITETVKKEAVILNLPSAFSLAFNDKCGPVATVQATKKLIGRRWEGETALMRMINDNRLIITGDKLRITDHLTIGDLSKYGITRQYLVDLGFVETITGKELTIANLNYHLNK